VASIEQVPWQVAVFGEFELAGKKEGILCGGSIIDLTHILTAGHCAVDPATGSPLTAASFVVVAGASALTEKEIKEGPTVQARFVASDRIHPDYDYAAGAGTPDDVAVLQLAEPLKASVAVQPIGLPTSASAPPEGTDAVFSGYGEENPNTEELNGKLYVLGTALQFPGECGGEADAVFVCGRNTGGSACNGDSGGGLTSEHALIGVVDIVFLVNGERCAHDARNGFVNVAAPEIRDFIEGSEDPPLAPRGRGVVIRGVTTAGHALTCEPGSWSNGPTFAYSFVNSANDQVLQMGASATYALTEADVGRRISCEVMASNAGGTGLARAEPLPAVTRAPVILPPTLPPPHPPSIGSSGAGSAGGQNVTEASAPESPNPSGEVAAGISASQIASVLSKEITPAGNSAKIATLLKATGFTIKFKALEAGRAVIDWYQVPPGAKLASKSGAKPILVASGQTSFSKAGTAKIKMKLTSAGKNLLKNTKSLKLTAKGTFTPTGMAPIIATRTFVLRR
jgi:hypothetical protein